MVAIDSGSASMALQQLAADVASPDLTYFMLRDAKNRHLAVNRRT
jgi:hypothetical protein